MYFHTRLLTSHFRDMYMYQVVRLGEEKVSSSFFSPGRPTDTYWLIVGQGLLSLQQVKVEGGMLLFLLFLHFLSFSSFFPIPLFHHFYCLFYLLSLFSLSLGDETK